MSKEKATVLIRRDTAIATGSMLKLPIASLYSESAPEGARILNWDPEGPDGETLLMAAEERATREVSQHVDRPFDLKWWVGKAVILPDPVTGEDTQLVRLVLISPEYETLAMTSIGAVHSLDLIRVTRGDGPYESPLKINIKLEKTRSGRTLYRLHLYDGDSQGK